jgi:hypothetical protein
LIEETDMKKQYDLLDWKLTVGEHEVQSGPAHLRCEMAGPDGMVTALQILTGTIVQLSNVPGVKFGGLVDADTVKPHHTTNIPKFMAELEDRLEAVKLENKKWVFESLKQATIDAMGPTYE